MKQRPLQNYLRTHRRRTGLSQDDVAMLLGGLRDTTISRHESFQRLPSLSQAFSYEVIYGISIHELFDGHFAETEGVTRSRASALLRQVERDSRGPRVPEKLKTLSMLCGTGSCWQSGR